MPQLVVFDRHSGRTTHEVGDRLTIGRDWTNDVQILDDKVSRNHAVIDQDGEAWVVRDLASHNGTYVNEERVTERPVHVGDRLLIGGTTLLFTQADVSPVETQGTVSKMDAAQEEEEKITVALKGDLDARFLDTGDMDAQPDLLAKAHHNLTTLFEIGNLLNSERDEAELLRKVGQKILDVVPCDACYIMDRARDGERFPVRAALRRDGNPAAPARLSRTVIQKVVEQGSSTLSYDARQDERFSGSVSVMMHDLRSVICAPLRSRERILGFIYAYTESARRRLTKNDLQMLTAVGIEAGIALENRRLFDDLNHLFLQTIEALAATIDARDGYTGGHSRRVADNAVIAGRSLGLEEKGLRAMRLGGILHDIGKIGIPDEVLKTAGRFGPDQWRHMRQHPVIGAEILRPIRNMEDVAGIVRHHHERWDGAGYPDGLEGNEIPLGARIVAITDAFDAVTSSRVYRSRGSVEEGAKALGEGAGTQFDPEVVPVFLAALAADRIRTADEEG